MPAPVPADVSSCLRDSLGWVMPRQIDGSTAEFSWPEPLCSFMCFLL
jgi:hypothetical protein